MSSIVDTTTSTRRWAGAKLLALTVMVMLFATGCTKEMVLDNIRGLVAPTLIRYGLMDRFEEIFGAFALTIAAFMSEQLKKAGINF